MNRKVVSIVLAVLLMGLVALPGCSEAELDECKALVAEQNATIEEQTAQIQSQNATIERLETEIGKAESERAEVPEDSKGPSYDELIEFMREDETEKLEYPGHDMYAQVFLENAEEKGIRGCLVTIRIKEGQTWFFTGFETTDKGWVYILPADDQEVKLEVGKKCNELNNFPDPGIDDTIVEITIHNKEEEAVEKEIKYGIIDGSIDDWPSDIAMVSDPAKDFTGDVKDERGVDLKAVQAFMNEDYLYVAIEIYDLFDLSLLRNYFIAVDCDKDDQDEYVFGCRPSGRTWVFDHTTDPNNWVVEWVSDVVAYGETNVIEVEIPRKAYEIPSSIYIFCYVTEGGPGVDYAELLEVSLDEGT